MQTPTIARLGTQTLRLADRDLLGRGGEACVYRHGDLALKIYHPEPPSRRSLRAAKLAAFPKNLPPEVIRPEALLHDPGGEVIGFSMKHVAGARDLGLLSRRRTIDAAPAAAELLAFFDRLQTVLGALHAAGVVAGDLNDGNVLVTPALEPRLIDADSMQFGTFRCTVAHERCLDPRLYGIDLSSRTVFDAGSDLYAFAVLLFSALTGVHPFGGVHPQLPTLLRRAEARVSVLRAEVVLPKTALPPGALPDELRAWFEDVFERDHRQPLDAAVLALPWTRCSCGLEHGRPACPRCAARGVVLPAPAKVRSGRCLAAPIARTEGRILAARVQAGLQYVLERDGAWWREDGELVTRAPAGPVRLVTAGRSTWIASGSRVAELRGGTIVSRTTTGTFAGEPVLAASAAGLVRTEGEWLLAGDRRIGAILEGQTWISSGSHLGFGFYLAGRMTVAFVFQPERAGLSMVPLPAFSGRLLDWAVTFDRQHLLASFQWEENGSPRAGVWLISDRGAVIASATGAPEDSPLLGSTSGKALFHGRGIVATDRGLALLRVDRLAQTLTLGDVFADTEPFVAQGAELLPGPGGSIYVVRPREITQLVLE